MAEYDDALVEKAAQKIGWIIHPESCDDSCRHIARAVLDAVTADIKAEALREAADELSPSGRQGTGHAGWLRDRADQIEGADHG